MDKDHYYTSNLALAAFISIWYPIETINRQNPDRAIFVFKRNKKLDSLVDDYWKGKSVVEPQTYFNQIKTIKTRLYSESTTTD